jgi:molecular chaperone DnaK (HSP70)
LIRKNTPIPVSKSEAFYTVFDGQRRVDINVYQGEDRDALNNIEIGRFTIDGLRDAPAGNAVITTFSLDVNGILHVTSREKDTGLANSITIDNAIARFADDKLAQARERIDGLFGERAEQTAAAGADADSSDTEGRRLRIEATALIEKAERALATAGAEDAEDLVDGIEALKDGLANPEADLKTALDALADLLYYLDT